MHATYWDVQSLDTPSPHPRFISFPHSLLSSKDTCTISTLLYAWSIPSGHLVRKYKLLSTTKMYHFKEMKKRLSDEVVDCKLLLCVQLAR